MISKRASVKAIAYAEKVTSTKLAKNANWETVFDAVMDGYGGYGGYEYSVQTQCHSTGDNTVIKLYKDDEMLELFTIPNSEIFDDSIHDWDWSYIYKVIVEWLMSKRKKPKKVKMTKKQIKDRVDALREIIKNEKGTKKRQAIKEYNTLSKLITPEPQPEAQPVQLSLEELRKQRERLCMKLSYNKKLGRNTTEIQRQLDEIRRVIKNYK